MRTREERTPLPPVIDVGTPPSRELLLAYAHARLHSFDDAFTREWHRVMNDELLWRHPKTGRPIAHWPDYFRQWRANRAFFAALRDPKRLQTACERRITEGERMNEAARVQRAKLHANAVAALTERDWALCAESCANCRASGGCLAGIVVPPDHRLNARPCSPAECPRFAAKEGGAA